MCTERRLCVEDCSRPCGETLEHLCSLQRQSKNNGLERIAATPESMQVCVRWITPKCQEIPPRGPTWPYYLWDLWIGKIVFPFPETLDFSPFISSDSSSYFYACSSFSVSTHLNLSSTKEEIFIHLSTDAFQMLIVPGTYWALSNYLMNEWI